jgi:predicted DNA-binding transcriptional regulator AlpA
MEPKLIRDIDAAEIIGCSRATFWRRVNDGTFPRPIKIGGISRWRPSDITDVIDRATALRE